MNKQSAGWFLAGCGILVIVLALGAVMLFKAGPTEPTYRDVGLSRWLNGSVVTRTGPGSYLGGGSMGQVLQSVGPDALPWLVREVERSGDREVRSCVYRWYARLHQNNSLASRWLPNPPVARWDIAEFNSVSLLARLAPGTPYEHKAVRAVLAVHPIAYGDFSRFRIHALGCFTNSPNEIIPVLVAQLTNSTTVDSTIEALQKFGPLATPKLYPIALRETGMIRPAEVALEKADERSYRRLREEKERLGMR